MLLTPLFIAALPILAPGVATATGPAETLPSLVDTVGSRGQQPRRLVAADSVEAQPLAATPEMQLWATEVTRPCAAEGMAARLECLRTAMFTDKLGFSYTSQETLTAEDAFVRREGNCFSFTALFVALSRSIGADTRFVHISAQRDVDQQGDLVVVSRHLAAVWLAGPESLLFDFGSSADVPLPGRFVILDDNVAHALFYNNRGGHLLENGAPEAAVPQFEQAVALAPDWPEAWVNLGVARRRLGDYSGAYAAYIRALEIDPGNSHALTDLSWMYEGLGDDDARIRALRTAARARDVTGYSLLALANVEHAHGNRGSARWALLRARLSLGRNPEIHDLLAVWSQQDDRDFWARYHQKRAMALRG